MVEGGSGARQEGNKFGSKVLKCESDKNKDLGRKTALMSMNNTSHHDKEKKDRKLQIKLSKI